MQRVSRWLSRLLCAALVACSSAALAADDKKSEEPPDPAADINAARPDSRKIEFETSEGTWMSVDVSPDGRTLVFDLLGDIYSIPIEGGRARSLTSGPAWDTHPRFSPDGKTIAFTSDRGGIENVWLMDADGSNPRALTSEKDAYVRGAGSGRSTATTAGPDRRRL
jgi:dipeptidyl aminopeptidase/acylaminoacyl peptidase